MPAADCCLPLIVSYFKTHVSVYIFFKLLLKHNFCIKICTLEKIATLLFICFPSINNKRLRKKKFLQTDFEGKNSCKEIHSKKDCYTEKEYLSRRVRLEKFLPRCMSGKKFYHQRLEKNRIITQTKPPIPFDPSKVKWSAPKLN